MQVASGTLLRRSWWRLLLAANLFGVAYTMSCCGSRSSTTTGITAAKALSTSSSALHSSNNNHIHSSTDASTTTTQRTAISSQRRTLYRRPLPGTCVALSSEEGEVRFASALRTGGTKSFFRLIEQYTTQSEPAYCGISTLVIVLNALAVDPRRSWKGPWRWYTENMLNCGLDLEDVKTTGITLLEFRCLAICQGLAVTVQRLDEDENHKDDNEGEGIGLINFRRAVERACVKTTMGATTAKDGGSKNDNENNKVEILVASYSRKVLGQTGSGHFSPIAAYDKESDSVLVLDTARFKYGAHWVGLPLLYEAMSPVDPDTGRSRGYILLSDHDDDQQDHEVSPSANVNATPTAYQQHSLIPSLLFRSQRKQNPIRREFRDFLATIGDEDDYTGVVDFDRVAAFWTKKSPKYIWKMLEPQFTPLEGEDEAAADTISLIAAVRSLIRDLLVHVKHQALPAECCRCRVNLMRTLDLSPEEAIFVVYLAALDEGKRKELVLTTKTATTTGESSSETAVVTHSDDGAVSTPAQTQLMAEAELVRHAIDCCVATD